MSSAVISECGLYRYRLERDCGLPFDGSKVFAYFGINPSTADAMLDDATVRKWRGFTLRNGGHRFIVGNVFPYRATDVQELATCADPIGDFLTYSSHTKQIAEDADILVPCWGNSSKVPKELRSRFDRFIAALRTTGKPIMTFGFTASGDPKHPLMLGYDTQLTPWSKP
jgi:hypothetical protein